MGCPWPWSCWRTRRRARRGLQSLGRARARVDHRLLSVAVSLETSWRGQLMTEPARRLPALLGQLPDIVAHADINVLLPGEGAGHRP